MPETNPPPSVVRSLDIVTQAVREKKLLESAGQNIRRWLTADRYAPLISGVVEAVEQGQWELLNDVFWTVLAFGTGGRRGRMHEFGTNAINDATIGESAQGLADYIQAQPRAQGERACAIAYDTRHKSRHFAELCSSVMVANGFRVYLLDDYRSTPELSFLVRFKQCDCGIMVTASHNPPRDNAVKVYWSTGGQLLPPHDQGVIECVENCQKILIEDFGRALDDGRVVVCTQETDEAFLEAVYQQRRAGPRDLKVVYSPLHGVGQSAVCPALKADGFQDVEVFAPHASPDGNFPNVPNQVANPENPEVYEDIIARARQLGADLVLATDPDCDRLGCAAPKTVDPSGDWGTFTGNQLGALLADYVLSQTPGLTSEHYLVKTLVTTEMIRRIGDSYGVRTIGDLPVGFKWIAGVIDREGPERFVLGMEESFGYLAGTHARDKDAAVAAMLTAEMAAAAKAAGESLHERLDRLFWQHGYHAERTLNVQMEGAAGMAQMQGLLQRLRTAPPESLGGMAVESRHADGPQNVPADMILLGFAEAGNFVVVRPSGTEPKVKLYLFTFVAAEQLADLDQTKQELDQRLDALEADLRAFVACVERETNA